MRRLWVLLAACCVALSSSGEASADGSRSGAKGPPPGAGSAAWEHGPPPPHHGGPKGPKYKRKGGQWGLTIGAAVCMPGRASCSHNTVSDGGTTLDGSTRPSFGGGFEVGFRFSKYLFSGLGYNFGMFDTSYELSNGSPYDRGHQHAIFLELRPIFPIWRLDVGVSVAPGVSRQVFTLRNGDKDYAQGFAFKIAPTVDFFVSREVFLGLKLDLILNTHTQTCHAVGDDDVCGGTTARDVTPVHQMILGVHIGTTFL